MPGHVVSDFTLKNQLGEDINFYDALDLTEQGIVIFVYPKANTPGCTKQALGFSENYDEIKQHGYEVFGMSRDKQTPQANWKKSRELPYDLLCEGDEVLRELGCLNGSSTTRSVFIVDKATRSLILERVKISPEESVVAVMKVVHKSESDESEEEHDEDGVESEKEEKPVKEAVKKAKAKPKAKSKARGRPPMEKKAPTKDEGTSTEKKAPAKRGASKRGADNESPVEKKRPARTASAKRSVKRSEPSGGEASGSPKKKQRKASETEDIPTATGRRLRAASQPVGGRASSRTRKATAEIEDVPKKTTRAPKETKAEPKAAAKKAAGAKARSDSSAPSKRGKK